MLKRLWNDETGSIVALEVILVGTILGIGIITGLASLRDAIITELADVGQAIANLDQSYQVYGSDAHSSATADSIYNDTRDFCDDADPGGTNSRCLDICATPVTHEDIGNDTGATLN